MRLIALAALVRVLGEEVIHQQRDVAGTFPQRRHVDGDHIQTVEEVFAEGALLDLAGQRLVGGRDDAHVDLAVFGVAHAAELAVLQHAQQLGLDGGGNVGDFVEEEGAAVGDFEQALLVGDRAGEGAALVAEEFAFQQRFRKVAAELRDERFVAARSVVVQRAGDQFLAGARLAFEQHGNVGMDDLRQHLEDVLHLLPSCR